MINTHLYGDQYVPRVAALGLDYLVTWTSLGQDGSREGVYGQFVHSTGSLTGGEFRVNTTTVGQQMQPSVASDGCGINLSWSGVRSPGCRMNLICSPSGTTTFPPLWRRCRAPFVWAPFVVSNGNYQPQLVVRLVAGAGHFGVQL